MNAMFPPPQEGCEVPPSPRCVVSVRKRWPCVSKTATKFVMPVQSLTTRRVRSGDHDGIPFEGAGPTQRGAPPRTGTDQSPALPSKVDFVIKSERPSADGMG